MSSDPGKEIEDEKHSSDEEEIVLTNIQWGYLNGWRAVRDGKKVKNESWQTYWADLSGPTLRLYRDKTLPPDSAKDIPPVTNIAPEEEDIHKAVFFSLRGGTVEILSEEELHTRKNRQLDFMRAYRRHLFKVSLPKINTAYVFQSPSRSSLLRWVSKVQEGIDQSDNHQATLEAEEQLRKAKLLIKKSKSHEELSMKRTVEFGSAEDLLIDSKSTLEKRGRIRELKAVLQRKQQLIKQLEQQEIDFLGGSESQEVIGEPFEGTLALDYCLIPGRLETYIPKGSKISIFGRLPNQRWRCYIDSSQLDNFDLQSSIQNRQFDSKLLLPNRADHSPSSTLSIIRTDSNASTFSRLRTDSDVSSASKITTSSELSVTDQLSIASEYDGTFPLVGNLPTTAIEELNPKEVEVDVPKVPAKQNNDDVSMTIGTPPSSPLLEEEEALCLSPDEEYPAAPYSPHKRNLSSASRQRAQNKAQALSGHLITNNNTYPSGKSPPLKEGFNPFQSLPNRVQLSKVDKRGVIESLSSDEDDDACELSDNSVPWPNRGSSIRQKIQERTQSFRKDIEKLGIQSRSGTMAPRYRSAGKEKKLKGKDVTDFLHKKKQPTIQEDLFISDDEGLFKNPVSKEKDEALSAEETNKALENLGVHLRTGDTGFVIRGKLRQKGISIVVGDSSSSEEEDEFEDEAINGRNEATDEQPQSEKDDVFQKILQSPSEKVITEDHNSNEIPQIAEMVESSSDLTLSSLTSSDDGIGRVTSGVDLLSQFSQNESEDTSELEIERPSPFSHSIGFELPPPKNTRRKLKLHKQQQKGFGFRLTTYRFLKEDGQTETSNFVSYVEDEGPAYIAGLRPGDVILEVDGKPVDEIDHKELTSLIKNFDLEMIVVVKYTNEGKKNELLVDVGNRQAKLREMFREYGRVLDMERSVKKEAPRTDTTVEDSPKLERPTKEDIMDFTDEIGQYYKEVVIWTSKFQRESSEVLHSIQESLFDGYASKSRRGISGMKSTTSSDLLYMYSSAAGLHDLDNISLSTDINETITGPIRNSATIDGYVGRKTSKPNMFDDKTATIGGHSPNVNSFGNNITNHVQMRQDKKSSPRSKERSKRHQSYKLAIDPGSVDLPAAEPTIHYI